MVVAYQILAVAKEVGVSTRNFQLGEKLMKNFMLSIASSKLNDVTDIAEWIQKHSIIKN
jgi:hypothetical protein